MVEVGIKLMYLCLETVMADKMKVAGVGNLRYYIICLISRFRNSKPRLPAKRSPYRRSCRASPE